ncbi:MAG: hypothetical protein DWQ19_11040 [Crenarchaeota archaeon]|nr:MAG: hypothetical protein DWQ19_11040 [Thermoproteota archaeon]
MSNHWLKQKEVSLSQIANVFSDYKNKTTAGSVEQYRAILETKLQLYLQSLVASNQIKRFHFCTTACKGGIIFDIVINNNYKDILSSYVWDHDFDKEEY